MSDRTARVKQVLYREAVVGKRCDVCGKEIPPTPDKFPRKEIPFFRVTIGHNDWGNDSGDSVEHLHACSPVCALQLAHEQLHEDFEGNHTRYIEIEHVPGWFMPTVEEETGKDDARPC